jgi:hypothetical protein
MRPYFLPLLLLPFVSACNNASGTRNEKKGDSASSGMGILPDSPAATAHPGGKRTDTAALNLEIITESTLSSSRENISVPPFGLAKVMAAIRKMQHVDDTVDDMKFTIALGDSIYNALSFDEKFTYNMIHAESYSQNCNALPEHMNDNDRIYGRLRDLFGEYSWSTRQLNFFKDNRDSVLQLMKAVIEKQGRVGMNFLEVILEINATDMTPYLIHTYQNYDMSNHYILTAMMELMEKNKYPEFLQSVSYKKLYGNAEATYSAYLSYNKANEDLIIQRATNFYNSRGAAAKP